MKPLHPFRGGVKRGSVALASQTWERQRISNCDRGACRAEGGGGGEGVGCCKEGRLWSRSGSRGGGGEGRSSRSVVDGVGCWSRSRITGSSCWCWSGSHWRCGIWWSHRNFSSTVRCMWVAGSTSTPRSVNRSHPPRQLHERLLSTVGRDKRSLIGDSTYDT